MQNRTIDISWTALWRIFFFVVLVAVIYIGRQVLLGLFLAIVISSGLEFIVNFFERRGLPRTFGVIIIFLSGAILLIMTLYTVLPGIILDMVHLNDVFQKLNKLDGSAFSLPFLNVKTIRTIGDFLNNLSTEMLSGDSPLGAFSNIVGGFALGISVIISSFYLSLSRNGVERFLLAVVPPALEADALRLYERSIRRIGVWFRGQLILSVILAAIVFGTLTVLGMKYALLLALLTAALELVPYIGPIIAGAASVVAALTTSPQLAFITLGAFIVIHEIEANILVPIVIGRQVGMHPVVVIVAILIGAEIAGFLGILVSIPAAVVLQELVEHWSDTKKQRPATA